MTIRGPSNILKSRCNLKLAPQSLNRITPLRRLPGPTTSIQIASTTPAQHRSTFAPTRPFHARPATAAMGADEDYEAFLNKANEDASGASASSAPSTKKASTKAVNTSSVPASLQNVDAFYTTDSDEPFEPVSLKYDGKKVPTAKQLGELIGKEEGVESISRKEFEAGGEYGEVVEAVEKASSGKIGFYRVELGGTRSEVWVVGVDGEGSLVGLKAVAILS